MGVQKLGARINQLQQAEDFAGAESLYGQVRFTSCSLIGHAGLSADWLKHFCVPVQRCGVQPGAAAPPVLCDRRPQPRLLSLGPLGKQSQVHVANFVVFSCFYTFLFCSNKLHSQV